LLAAAAAYVAYGRVAAFRDAVDAAVAGAKGSVREWGAGASAAGAAGGSKPSASSSLLRSSTSSYSAVPV
jgi:hypothetical protein